MRLILFDIDGTILRVNSVGRHAVSQAIEHTFGHPFEYRSMSFSGKTDPQILAELMSKNGYDPTQQEDRQVEVLDRYVQVMHDRLGQQHVELLPGIRPLLEDLAERAHLQLGILTGNLEPTARLKLDMAELGSYFPVGAYGSDDANRYKLPQIALNRAETYTGQSISGSDVLMIGDTEHDIRCIREIGGRSVAVCTGRYSREDLEAHDPDLLLPDLSQARNAIEQLLEPV